MNNKNICIFSEFKIKNDNSPDVCDENRAVNVSTQCKYPSLLVPNCGLFIEVVQYFIFNGASNAAAARHGRADHKSNSSNVFTIKNRSERREEMEVGDLSSLTSYFKFNYISLWPVVVSCFFTNTNNDSGRVFPSSLLMEAGERERSKNKGFIFYVNGPNGFSD